MGTLENHHSKNDVISIRYEEIRFRLWAPKLRYSATLYNAAPVRERNVVRQLIDRSTLRWRSLVTWRGSFRRMSGYGRTAHGGVPDDLPDIDLSWIVDAFQRKPLGGHDPILVQTPGDVPNGAAFDVLFEDAADTRITFDQRLLRPAVSRR